MAYGRLGWDEEKFFNSKPSFLYKALKGFNDLEKERDKQEWERLRLLGSWVLSPYAKKGQPVIPKTLLPLPWDKKKSWIEENKEILDRCDEMIRNGQ